MLKTFERVLQILILRHQKVPYDLKDLAIRWRVHEKTARRTDQLATEVLQLLSRLGVSLRF